MKSLRSNVSLQVAVMLVLAGLIPLFASEYMLHIAVLVLLYAYLSTAWNILGGYAGQHSLGHSLYLGIGAYTSTLLFNKIGLTPWMGMWAGALLAGLAGWFIGYLCFRYGLKGAYFALVTIAIAEAAVYLTNNVDAIGGAQGMEVKWIGNFPQLMQFGSKGGYYYTVLIMTGAAVWFANWLSRRRFGYRLMAIRENEDAAETLGVDTLAAKIQALVISAALTALGGSFFAQYFTYISPRNVFGEGPSVQILLFSIIGGLGTVWGPLLGALVLVPIAELSRSWVGGTFAGLNLLFYGTVLVLVMLFMPRGIIGLIDAIRLRFSNRPPRKERNTP